MRARGRPPQRAHDIQLVWMVRNALERDPNLTVEKACEQILRAQLLKAATVEQLARRYHRVATAYPDRIIEEEGAPSHWPVWMKVALGRTKRKQRLSLGVALLTVNPIRKPSK